jgi:hypothetical protein
MEQAMSWSTLGADVTIDSTLAIVGRILPDAID